MIANNIHKYNCLTEAMTYIRANQTNEFKVGDQTHHVFSDGSCVVFLEDGPRISYWPTLDQRRKSK